MIGGKSATLFGAKQTGKFLRIAMREPELRSWGGVLVRGDAHNHGPSHALIGKRWRSALDHKISRRLRVQQDSREQWQVA